jgi:hypothetical protein
MRTFPNLFTVQVGFDSIKMRQWFKASDACPVSRPHLPSGRSRSLANLQYGGGGDSETQIRHCSKGEVTLKHRSDIAVRGR